MSRKKHSKELKARIALDAIKGQKTMSELASEYGVHFTYHDPLPFFPKNRDPALMVFRGWHIVFTTAP